MKKHLLRYFLPCLMALASLAAYPQGNGKGNRLSAIDSLLNLLATTKDDTNKVNVLNRLCQEYRNEDPQKALNYGKLAMTEAEVIGYKKGMASAYENFGRIYQNKGEYHDALDNYLKSLNIYEEIKSLSGITSGLINIGSIYYFQENYTRALDYFVQSLEYYSNAGDSAGLGAVLDNIGVINKQKGDFEEAIRYHERSMDIRKTINDQDGIASCLENIAIAYAMQDKMEQAIEFIKKALAIRQRLGDKFRLARILGNVGEMYGDLAEIVYKPKGDAIQVHASFEIAAEYIQNSLELAKEIGAKNEMMYAYENLAAIYSEIGEPRKAYSYQILFSTIKDSIYAQERASSMAEMQAKYEVDKERKEKELLQKDKELQDVQLNKQSIIIWSTAAGIALLLALVFVVFRGYRQKQKVNLTLERKNSSILRQKEEIERINTELEKLSIVASETDNAVLIMDAAGKIEWANRGFTRMFGYTLEEYVSEKGANLMDVSSNPAIKPLIANCIEVGKSVVYESLNQAKDGTEHWVQTTLTPILKKNGTVDKLVAIDSDITAQKNAEHEIQEKSREITDSIRYAQGIQQAILPTPEDMAQALPDNFVLFKPQAIVSGDFYWMTEKGNQVFFCAADCTGHGVPGAFMSMMCSSLLSEAVNEKGLLKPSEIFYEVRKGLITNLKQTEATQKDGMDAALCILDKKANTMEFAAANNSFLLINPKRDQWPETAEQFGEGWGGEIKPDKQPVGYLSGEQIPFTDHKFTIAKGDTIYIYSDGFLDQFGGEKDKKYGRKRFKELLLSIQAKSMPVQKEILDKTIEGWKGDRAQIDDILVIGVRFS